MIRSTCWWTDRYILCLWMCWQNKWTALHWAVDSRHNDVIYLLMNWQNRQIYLYVCVDRTSGQPYTGQWTADTMMSSTCWWTDRIDRYIYMCVLTEQVDGPTLGSGPRPQWGRLPAGGGRCSCRQGQHGESHWSLVSCTLRGQNQNHLSNDSIFSNKNGNGLDT